MSQLKTFMFWITIAGNYACSELKLSRAQVIRIMKIYQFMNLTTPTYTEFAHTRMRGCTLSHHMEKQGVVERCNPVRKVLGWAIKMGVVIIKWGWPKSLYNTTYNSYIRPCKIMPKMLIAGIILQCLRVPLILK